jgi:hypothetical protein
MSPGWLSCPPAVAARQQPWTADEARRFLSRARSDPLYAVFVLMLVYGLRRRPESQGSDRPHQQAPEWWRRVTVAVTSAVSRHLASCISAPDGL